jgi:hypothetical protein
MNRAHPVQLRKGLEMAQSLVNAGLEFVPIPSLGVDDYSDLVDQLGARMSALAVEAEAEEAGARARPVEPTYREQLEAIARDDVLVHAPLYAHRHGIIKSYLEAVERMALSMSGHIKDLRRRLVSMHIHSAVPMCGTCGTPIRSDGQTGTACDCSHPKPVTPWVALMPTFSDYPASVERDMQIAFKQAVEASGGRMVDD